MRGRTNLKLFLLTVPLLCVVGIVLNSERSPTYIQVDELTAHRGNWAGQSVTVHGIVLSPARLGREWQFQLKGRESIMDVHYGGIVPSTFVDKADVVVVGRVQPSDGFTADAVLVKVPE